MYNKRKESTVVPKYTKLSRQHTLQYRVDHPELSVNVVYRNLGISEPALYTWKNDVLDNDGEGVHVGSENYARDEQREIARLRRELRDKEDSLMILKKL